MADNRKFVQGRIYKLAGSGVTSSATTITLQSFQTPDGSNITSSDIGNKGWAVIESGTDREETISFTGVTQNNDGTADLTGVTRGIGYTAPYNSVSSLKQSHSGGTSLILSNPPSFYDEFANKYNDETIQQEWTYPSGKPPRLDSYAAPTSNEQLAPKKYVDDTAAGGTVNVDELIIEGTAGESVSAGDFVYLDTSDNEWKKTDATTANTVEKVLLGIAQGSGSDGNGISGGVMLKGIDGNQSGLSAGNTQFLSDTNGTISNSAGSTEVPVGVAHSSSEILFVPYFNLFLTASQQDKLESLTASASELNNLDGYTGSTSLLNESATFFNNTDITGSEAETLTDGSDASSLHAHSFNERIATDTSQTNLSNSTTETTMISGTIPGGTLGSNNGVQAKVYFVNFQIPDQGATNRFATFRVKFGGTTYATLNLKNNSGGDLDFEMFMVDVVLFGAGGTSSQKTVLEAWGTENNPTSNTPINSLGGSAVGSGTKDSTSNQTLAVTCEFQEASTTLQYTQELAFISTIVT